MNTLFEVTHPNNLLKLLNFIEVPHRHKKKSFFFFLGIFLLLLQRKNVLLFSTIAHGFIAYVYLISNNDGYKFPKVLKSLFLPFKNLFLRCKNLSLRYWKSRKVISFHPSAQTEIDSRICMHWLESQICFSKKTILFYFCIIRPANHEIH